jgi:hypothetical protein
MWRETCRQEVEDHRDNQPGGGYRKWCSRVLANEYYALTVEFVLSQNIPSSDPVDQGEEETWDTVGAAAERSASPPPTTGEVVPAPAQQVAGADNSQMSAEERRPDPRWWSS